MSHRDAASAAVHRPRVVDAVRHQGIACHRGGHCHRSRWCEDAALLTKIFQGKFRHNGASVVVHHLRRADIACHQEIACRHVVTLESAATEIATRAIAAAGHSEAGEAASQAGMKLKTDAASPMAHTLQQSHGAGHQIEVVEAVARRTTAVAEEEISILRRHDREV